MDGAVPACLLHHRQRMFTLGRAKHSVYGIQIVLVEHQLGCSGIEPHVFGRNRLGNSDHPVLTQHPRQGNLRGRSFMAASNLLERRAGQQLTP